MKLSRRNILLGGGARAASTVGAGFALSLGAAAGAQVLTSPELRVVDAAAEVLFPGVHFPLDGIEAGVSAEVDRIGEQIATG